MRVYLDTNVYTHLKHEENASGLSLISRDKLRNVYLFSEAHIYDLVRDKTDQKIQDMEFIQQICDLNCYYFDKKILYEHFSPTQYYKRYDWDALVIQEETDLLAPLKSILSNIPIKINDYVRMEEIPIDCPPVFKKLLDKTTNLYEFFLGFMDMTDALSHEQTSFKEFLKYLHANSLTASAYESTGIKGYDGNKITDHQAFKDSYTNYIATISTKKDIYSVFMLMYNALEILGLIKGKPRKQKFLNLINDSRHAYFGSFCDVVVSEDQDFVNKCNFLYEALGLDINVCDLKELQAILKDEKLFPSSHEDLLQDIRQFKTKEVRKVKAEDDREYFMIDLGHWPYGYFDSLSFTQEEKLNRFVFSKERNSFSFKAIQPEIEYLVNKLCAEHGPDYQNRALFDNGEFSENNWVGRHWIKDGLIIELLLHDKLFIRISSLHQD